MTVLVNQDSRADIHGPAAAAGPEPTRHSPWPPAAQDPTAIALHSVAHLPRDHPTRRRIRDEAVCRHIPLARKVAARFANRGEANEDLYQVAMLGLIQAADRFDATRCVSFVGYAVPTIVGALRHHFRDTRWHMHVDRRLQELYLETRDTVDYLTQELQRRPTDAETASRMKVEPAMVRAGIAAGRALQPQSLSETLDAGHTDTRYQDILGEEDPRLLNLADRCALTQVLACLPETEQGLLKLRFVDDLTQTQIARRIGVSQMQVSRLLTAVLAKLRAALLAEE
jgi:RNA polymerase sigma-B factor